MRRGSKEANPNCWRILKAYLGRTSAHVVLVQELSLLDDESTAEASTWCIEHGWKCLMSASVPGPNGGPSAGVGIFVRQEFGLREPTPGDAGSAVI